MDTLPRQLADPDVVDEVRVRSMTSGDVEQSVAATEASFGDLDARLRRPPRGADGGRAEWARGRAAHCLRTSPEGAFVAVAPDGAVVGAALAVRRGALWVLSLLAVAPGWQGYGVGRRLLEAALTAAEGASGRLICASRDPAALRRYARSGHVLHPVLEATGRLERAGLAATPRVRDGGPDDLPLAAEVDRGVRGEPHGVDLEWLLERETSRLLVLDREGQRGYALASPPGQPRMVAATAPAVAAELLTAALAQAPPETDVSVPWISAAQPWAVDVALAAGLELHAGGSLCVQGDVGPMTPYLPHGAFL